MEIFLSDSSNTAEESKDISYYSSVGDLEKVKAILNQNPELVNQKDSEGRAPIHYACDRANINLLTLLLQNNADVNLHVT